MSQFLICKSKYDMCMFGKKIKEASPNRDIYAKVVNKYLRNEDLDSLWVIPNIHEMANSLKININLLESISQKSSKMVFWYGSDYENLDVIRSRQELIHYLEDNLGNMCLEIYLLCEFSDE